MSGGIYLTIDDGPSERFEALVDFLHMRGVPAVFFNRGDAMALRPQACVRAIQKGFVIASHAYSHRRFSTLTLNEAREEIERTDKTIEDLYVMAGIARPARYFRFPYMDRGMGSSLLEPGSIPPAAQGPYDRLVKTGLGHVMAEPSAAMISHKRALQALLRECGYAALPTPGVDAPLYAQTEMADAIDSLCTFSTSDWALTARHRGRHGFNDIQDLKALIDSDPDLGRPGGRHIVLAHDQAEIHEVTTALIQYFLDRGFEFLDFSLKS